MRYISHLDVLRSWERSIRRAGLPLTYSQGFTPHPKLAFAGPLPLGFTSEAEIMDVTLDERVDPADFEARIAAETTEDLAVVAVEEVPLSAPQPQSSVIWADYRCDLPGIDAVDATGSVEAFLASTDVPWTEERKEKTRQYNLREMVGQLSAAPIDGGTRLTMRLRASQELTGRPEQLVAAVFPEAQPLVYCRTGILLDEPSPARDAWRRKGQYLS